VRVSPRSSASWRGVGQLLEVLDAREGLGRGLVFQGADVSAAVVEELDELGEGCVVAGAAEGFAIGGRGFAVAVHAVGVENGVEAGFLRASSFVADSVANSSG